MDKHCKELNVEALDALKKWLHQYQVNWSIKIHREMSDAVGVAALLKKFYPKIVEMHNYPSYNTTQLKMINWETLNSKVLIRIGMRQSKGNLEKLAKATPGVIDLLLFDIMVHEKSNSGDEKPTEQEKLWTQNDDVMYVPVNKREGDSVVQVPQKMILYSIYEEAVRESQSKDSLLNAARQKIAHYENILKLKGDRIDELCTQLAKQSTAFWCALGAILIGGILVISYWIRRCRKVKHIMKKLHKQNGLKRSNSAIEFDVSALSAANRRHIYSSNRSASSEQDNSDQSEHSEKSPLVSARLDNLARIFFSKSMPAETGSRDTIESVLTTRPNLKYQYSALDSGNGVVERSPRERAHRERALNATQEWIQQSNGRYEVIAHLDEIGSRHGKNWFLVTDSSVRTDRLMTLLPLPPDCVALEDLPPEENPQGMLMELLGSLHHPYIYPVLDLGFLQTNSTSYACLVTPFNSRGSLKDLIYKTQWNEPWARKYTRKPNGLPVSQVQRLGRQILEALLFLKERGFPLHGHLHSGNVILQNGAARLSGLENGLLGLSSRINAIMWSRSTTEIENVDILCFGHLLYEMCTGQEMTTPKPSMQMLEMELDNYPQIVDILGLIFEPASGVCPSVEDLVLCDLFRSIDLRELRGPCFSTIKPSLSRSTLNLLHAVKKRQCASLGNSFSEGSPCTPPSTPRDRRSGIISRTMDSFDISSDSEDGLLDEIVVGGGNYQRQQHMQQLRRLQYYQQQQQDLQYARQNGASCYQQQAHCSPQHQHYSTRQTTYEARESPIHYCDTAAVHSDDNSCSAHEQPEQPEQQHQHSSLLCSTAGQACTGATSRSGGSTTSSGVCVVGAGTGGGGATTMPAISTNSEDDVAAVDSAEPSVQLELCEVHEPDHHAAARNAHSHSSNGHHLHASTSAAASAGASFNHQLTTDMCSYKNSKSRRLEYSLKCLKYGRSNPSQDSAFGSLTDNDLSIGSSSFRISSFQSISSPIDEGVEDIIIATTAGNDTCLELATIPHSMVSQDSAISSPCRELSPSNFLHIDDAMSASSSAGSSSSGSTGNVRPHQFPVSLSPKILVTATTNSSNSSLSSAGNGPSVQQQQPQAQQSAQPPQQQQFDPPKILVNDQNSIYTTSPSKRSGTIEVFSQKYRVSSFEDMSPNKRSASAGSDRHLKHVNRMAFRSLEEERRIDSAFMPITDRTNSENRVNMQSEKYKKLTHASFRISKTASQMTVFDTSPGQAEVQRPATAAGSTSSSNRQTMWRDSKFYRKNRIAKSNDSLLETSPSHHSARLSPSLVCDKYGSGLAVTTSFCGSASGGGSGEGGGGSSRRYCSSKSEDLGDSSDYLRVMDARKSYSERHLVTLTKLKQTAINNTMDGGEQCCLSEDDISFNDDNNAYGYQYQYEQQQQHPKSQQYHHQHQPHQQRHYNQHHHHHHHHQYRQAQQQQQLVPQRPHPNQLSWSTCSINRLKTSNIKTTSLATLPCHPNPTSPAASVPNLQTTAASSYASMCDSRSPAASRSSLFKSLDQALNATDNSSSSGCGGGAATTNEDNSSPDESPSHQTLSAAELSKIFAMDDPQGSSCEEKTPLLDSVEMSPISPTEPEPEPHGEQM